MPTPPTEIIEPPSFAHTCSDCGEVAEFHLVRRQASGLASLIPGRTGNR